MKDFPSLEAKFPRYQEFDCEVPVWCVTPSLSKVMHRFYDTSPFSPSGRYLAVTQIAYEDRLPSPGEAAKIILSDLATGKNRTVAETCGWDTQQGAQVQWGADDHQLFFNDLDTNSWRPHGVRLDPFTGEKFQLEGTIYMVSPDGNLAASPCLRRTAHNQAGYGVVIPHENIPRNHGLPDDDGIYLTDTITGGSKLLISLKKLMENAKPEIDLERYRNYDFYGWHVKWNNRGDKLMFNVKALPRKQPSGWKRFFRRGKGRKLDRRTFLLVLDRQAKNIQLVVSDEEWARGAHHANWCPDGQSIIMNLNVNRDGLKVVRARYDEFGYKVLNEKIEGSGHPTMHPDNRHILTDAYPSEKVAGNNDTSPIRWIDFRDGYERTLLRIHSVPKFRGPRGELRVDLHPAWDSTFCRIAFNACPSGTRQVFVADLAQLLDGGQK